MLFGYTPGDFQAFKTFLIQESGLDKDALHIYAGMTIFLIMRLLWRWRGGWFIAWLSALALALCVEWIDIQARETAPDYLKPDPEHWHDVWNTMFWPTILLLFGRWLQPKPESEIESSAEPLAAEKDELSGDLADQSFKETPSI